MWETPLEKLPNTPEKILGFFNHPQIVIDLMGIGFFLAASSVCTCQNGISIVSEIGV